MAGACSVQGEVRSNRHALWLGRFRLDAGKIFFPRSLRQPQQVSKEVGDLHPQVWLDKASGHPQLAPVVAFLSAEGLFHTTALSQT